jgi:hypothetical protein
VRARRRVRRRRRAWLRGRERARRSARMLGPVARPVRARWMRRPARPGTASRASPRRTIRGRCRVQAWRVAAPWRARRVDMCRPASARSSFWPRDWPRDRRSGCRRRPGRAC